MIGSLGMPELLFILVLALLVFGPKRLPQVGKTLGKGLREFRRATSDLKRTVEVEMEAEERPTPRPVATAVPVEAAPAADNEPDATESGAATPADETAAAADSDGEPGVDPEADSKGAGSGAERG